MLSGCSTFLSSGCRSEISNNYPDDGRVPQAKKCSYEDAAIYLGYALYKEYEMTEEEKKERDKKLENLNRKYPSP